MLRMLLAVMMVSGMLVSGGMPSGAQTVATPATSLLVLAKNDRTLAIVDPASLKVVARVPVGPEPHEVIASDDGRTAWVTNYLNGSDHTITVVDLVAQKVLKTIDLGPLFGPHGLFVAGGKPYFTAERAKMIGRLDPEAETVDWQLGTGQIGTHMLWVSRDGRKIVTVNVGSGTLSLLEEKLPTPADRFPSMLSKQGGITRRNGIETPDWTERVVKVGTFPEGFDVLVDAEGNPSAIWVANAVEGTVSVVYWVSGTVVKTIETDVVSANRLRFTPDGKLALISRQKSGDVAVLEVPSGRVLRQIAVGTGAAGVLVTPDGKRAFVSCSPDNAVAVIDLGSMKVVGKVQPGANPDGLAWAVRR